MWFQGRVSVKLLKTGRIRIDYLDHSQLKAIVRFAYGLTGRDYRADPKDLDRLVGHIRQLGKVFQDNHDVQYGVQRRPICDPSRQRRDHLRRGDWLQHPFQ
jgi:hypothetical protein